MSVLEVNNVSKRFGSLVARESGPLQQV